MKLYLPDFIIDFFCFPFVTFHLHKLTFVHYDHTNSVFSPLMDTVLRFEFKVNAIYNTYNIL